MKNSSLIKSILVMSCLSVGFAAICQPPPPPPPPTPPNGVPLDGGVLGMLIGLGAYGLKKYFNMDFKKVFSIVIVVFLINLNFSFAQNVPGCIGSNDGTSELLLWLKSDSGVVTSGSDVNQWQDLSGRNNHVTPYTSSTKPAYNNAGNIPFLAFNGTQALSTAGVSVDFANPEISIFIVGSGPWDGASFCVGNPNNAINQMVVFRWGIVGANKVQATHHWSSGSFVQKAHHCNDNVPASQLKIQTTIFGSNTNDITYRVNGVASTDANESYGGPLNYTFSPRMAAIGARFGHFGGIETMFEGNIYEVIMYNRKLTTAEQIKVETYLQQKYNIKNNNCGSLTSTEWTAGAGTTDWFTPSNWSGATVPGLSDNVIIPSNPSGGLIFPVLNAALQMGKVRIENGASLSVGAGNGVTLNDVLINEGDFILQSDATGDAFLDDYSVPCSQLEGDLTVERYIHGITGSNQHLYSFPVRGDLTNVGIANDLQGPPGYAGLMGTNGLGITPSASCDPNAIDPSSNYGTLFEWDLATAATHPSCAEQAGWIVRSSGLVSPAQGYSAYFSGLATVDVTGEANTGDINFSNGLQTGTTVNPLIDHWNILGNPYPTPIDYVDVMSANIPVSSLAQYTPSGPYSGTYLPYMPGDLIAIGQGFGARNGAGVTASFSLTDAMRRMMNTNNWKSNDWFEAGLEVEIEGNGFADKTYLFYDEMGTDNFERIYDVEKRRSKYGQPSIFSHINYVELAMQTIENSQDLSHIFNIGISTEIDGMFKIFLPDLSDIPTEYDIYIIDLEEGIRQNASFNNGIELFLEAGIYLDRFQVEIVRKEVEVTGIQALAGFENLSVFPNPTSDFVHVHVEDDKLETMVLIDLTGKVIKTFNPALTKLDVRDVTNGVYFLQLSNATKKLVFKLAIK